jgi:haloacetate dehalogenase
MEIMPGFTLTDIETSGAQIRLRHGSNGPPLLLLHGNPLTHVSWHAVAPRLAERFHVVAADLRGYDDSSAPPEEPDSSNYSFRAMAQDQVEVMKALGYDRFYVAGHDRGGRTVHRMCLDHPEKVIKAAIIDIAPTLDMWDFCSGASRIPSRTPAAAISDISHMPWTTSTTPAAPLSPTA